jgi:hypothetical protein
MPEAPNISAPLPAASLPMPAERVDDCAPREAGMTGTPEARMRGLLPLAGPLVLFVLGAGFVWGAAGYGFGSAATVGPGYFPAVLGVIAMMLALIIGWSSQGHSDAPPVEWRASIFIAAGIGSFIAILPLFGFLPAAFSCTLVSALASRDMPFSHAVVLASGVALTAWIVFLQGLKVSVPAFQFGL